MLVTNEKLARWSATISTVCAYTDDEKARDILTGVCADMDNMIKEHLVQLKPYEYTMSIDAPADKPVEIAAVCVPEPVAPTVRNTVEPDVPDVEESSMTVGKKLAWNDDEWSIIRCASSKPQAIEYYHQSDYNGNHTDKAVEQAYYRAKANRELIRVNDKVQIDIKGNAYQGKMAHVKKICDDKMHAILDCDNNRMQVKIAGLKVISHE